jgi:hypothetical protein
LHPGWIASTNSNPPNEEAGEIESCANATDTPIIMPTDTPPKRHFVKTNQPNLAKLMPLGADHGMV